MDLTQYDHIVINTSAGKDSQAMMHHVHALAVKQGVSDRLLAVHADLGRVEWKGTRELAITQCEHYGIPIQIVRREKGDLLEQVEARGKWPDSANRYCTSDQKRDQAAKVIRALPGARILNCMGFRKQESPARAKRKALSKDDRLSTAKRTVTVWLPIHKWTTDDVWKTIRASGVPHHPAYDLGMPRLSCVFCIFAPVQALRLAAKHNPELFAEYARVEAAIGHDFRKGFKIASIQDNSPEQPEPIQNWTM